jgi:hypothetical protein
MCFAQNGEPRMEKKDSANFEYERAKHLAKLMDEVRFNKVMSAIKKNDKDAFIKECESADVPETIYNHIWDIIEKLGYNKKTGSTFPPGMIW